MDGNNVFVILCERDDDGDATVPSSSMHIENISGLQSVRVINNIEHGAAFNNNLALKITICSIFYISKRYKDGNV